MEVLQGMASYKMSAEELAKQSSDRAAAIMAMQDQVPAGPQKHGDKTLELAEHEVLTKFVEGVAEQVAHKGALSVADKSAKAESAASAIEKASTAKNHATENFNKAMQQLKKTRSEAAARTGTAKSMVAKELEEKVAQRLVKETSAELFKATAKEGMAKGLSEATAKDLAKATLKQVFKEAAKDFSVAFGRAVFLWAFLDPNEGIATYEQEHAAWEKQNAQERAEAAKELDKKLKETLNKKR